MKVTIYGIKNCDTMKKAFDWLEANGVEYSFHDYKKDGVPNEKLTSWTRVVGWEKLINTRGPAYRKVPDAERVGLNEAKALRLLSRHPSAIKRPILELDGKILIGYEADDYSRAFAIARR